VGVGQGWFRFQAALPPLATLWVILFFWSLYVWQRRRSYQRRERRRQEEPAEKLDIPSGLKKPEDYDGGKGLHEAQWTYIHRAVEAQGRYFANGIVAAILPPLALFLLSFQILALADGGNWAVGLILSEVLCLIVLVYFALTNREPTSEWIENRVRTELLRREQYLLLAGVGPYLAKDQSDAVEEALRRRGQIEAADGRILVGLIPLQDPSGLTWLEILHGASGNLQSRTDCLERMDSYLYYRIGKQSLWFANELRDCEENERLWSRLLTGALLAAIVAATMHIFQLLRAGCETSHDAMSWHVAVGVLAIALPPLGIACLSIRAMYNFRGRSQIYSYEKGLLHIHRGTLEALITKAKNSATSGSNSPNLKMTDFDFRALALRTEHSLSMEMQQWMLLMERRELEVSP
jgi:hypothetical protein